MKIRELKNKILQTFIKKYNNSNISNYKIGDFLIRKKDAIKIEDNIKYKRVTIKSKNKGIILRDNIWGNNIGTKNQFIIKSGQFLLSKIDARNGAFGIVPLELDKAIITGNFWAYEIDTTLVEINWFNLYVSLTDFIEICESTSSGSTNRKYLNEEKFLNFEVSLPSLEEQKYIVKKVEQLFSLIDELEGNKQDLLEGIKKSREKVLQLAIEGRLVEQSKNDTPAKFLLEEIKAEKERLIKEKKIKKEKPLPEITDEEKYFELPRGWEWCRLNDISQYIQRGKSPKYSEIKNIPVISQKCIQWSGLNIEAARFIDPDTLEEYSNERMLEVGDLLWNSTGSGTLGRISIYPRVDQYKKVVVDSHVTVVRVLKKLINFNYLFVWLAGPIVQSEIEKRSNGSTNQIELSTGTIKSYLVPLPPLEEQRRIVAKVDELMKYFDDLEKQIYS